MKKFLKIATWVAIIFPFTANSQVTADLVKIHDTRDALDSPKAYNRIVRFDFKRRSSVGVPGLSTYSGQITIAPWSDNSGGRHHQLNFNDGGIFYRTGRPDDATWSSWQRFVLENADGNVGIGTDTPDEMLSVNGNIRAKEIKVEASNWPDYVFKDEYKLRPLTELKNYIETHGHLPAIPTEDEVIENGVHLGIMNVKLLEKIEELTLYIIEQNEQVVL